MGKREQNVGADAVEAPGRAAEHHRGALREPALHPACRNRDNLGREGIAERIGEQSGEGVGKVIGPLSAVNLQHAADRL